MEMMIPLVAMGGLWAVSKLTHPSKKTSSPMTEGFRSLLQATPFPDKDIILPDTPSSPLDSSSSNSFPLETTAAYSSSLEATQDYFNQTQYQKAVQQGQQMPTHIPNVIQMEGSYEFDPYYAHQNMNPFNGGKVRGQAYHFNNQEAVLDTLTGAGSQQNRKGELSPLFKPEENMAWVHGMPTTSDFIQSRIVPSLRDNGLRSVEPVQVAPGLNQGYGSEGHGGFNAGLEGREYYMPKSVDDLRISTNPKMEYELSNLEGPARALIYNATSTDQIGAFEKNHPDRVFHQTKDQWLVTTGAQKGPHIRPLEDLKQVQRTNEPIFHPGALSAQNTFFPPVDENYEPSKRQALPMHPMSHPTHVHATPFESGDRRQQSFQAGQTVTQRSTLPEANHTGALFRSAVGAVIAPLLDVLNPTRKQELIQQHRMGQPFAQHRVFSNGAAASQTAPATTMKETTLHQPRFQIYNPKESHYVNDVQTPNATLRDQTQVAYIPTPGGAGTGQGQMDYAAAYRQSPNEIKSSTIQGRTNMGNMAIFQPMVNTTTFREDTNRYDGRTGVAGASIQLPPSFEQMGQLRGPQTYAEPDRINPEILKAFRDNPFTTHYVN